MSNSIPAKSSQDLRAQLCELEQRYDMPSATFYERFRAGELGDELDFVDWAGLCSTTIRLGIFTPATPRQSA